MYLYRFRQITNCVSVADLSTPRHLEKPLLLKFGRILLCLHCHRATLLLTLVSDDKAILLYLVDRLR